MIDDRVRAVLARLEAEDAQERAEGLPAAVRSRQVPPATGRFLHAFVAHHPGCEVLEIGGSRGYSGIWLASALRRLGGRLLSLEVDPVKCDAWTRNVAEAGLEEWAELAPGDAMETLAALGGSFDVVFIDAEKQDYERLFHAARPLLEPGAVVIADNVLSHADPLARYSTARQADPTVLSVTVPLDRGLEVTTIV